MSWQRWIPVGIAGWAAWADRGRGRRAVQIGPRGSGTRVAQWQTALIRKLKPIAATGYRGQLIKSWGSYVNGNASILSIKLRDTSAATKQRARRAAEAVPGMHVRFSPMKGSPWVQMEFKPLGKVLPLRGRRRTASAAWKVSPYNPDLTLHDYRGLFQDSNKNTVPDVDDAYPHVSGSTTRVEETLLSNAVKSLLRERPAWEHVRGDVVGQLKQLAPASAEIQSRAKTPYSTINKLIKSRLYDKEHGLKDYIGTKVITDNVAELRKVARAIENGALGAKPTTTKDYLAQPKEDGYRAVHFILPIGRGPDGEQLVVEVQVTSRRLVIVQELTHEPYKRDQLDNAGAQKLYALAYKADNGNKRAIREFDWLIRTPEASAMVWRQSGQTARRRSGRRRSGRRLKRINEALEGFDEWITV